MNEPIGVWDSDVGDAEPIVFRLAGIDFPCVPVCPWGVLADYNMAIRNGVVPVQNARSFISAVLVDEKQFEVFEKVVRDRNRPITLGQVQEIVDALLERYTARPTVPPTGSSGGRKNTAATSKAGSSSRAGTRAG